METKISTEKEVFQSSGNDPISSNFNVLKFRILKMESVRLRGNGVLQELARPLYKCFSCKGLDPPAHSGRGQDLSAAVKVSSKVLYPNCFWLWTSPTPFSTLETRLKSTIGVKMSECPITLERQVWAHS